MGVRERGLGRRKLVGKSRKKEIYGRPRENLSAEKWASKRERKLDEDVADTTN